MPGDIEWGLKVSVRDLDAAYSKSVKGLILCSPCNPTGAVYTLAELKAIAEWAHKHQVWIISDEIYRRINYGPGPGGVDAGPARRAARAHGDHLRRRKAYAMTGWRIGAALAPPHLAKAMAALQSHTTTGANHPAQWAAATAFTDERVDQEVTRMVAAFRRRRDQLVDRFRAEAPGVEFVEPHGAFYFFFRVDGIRDGAHRRQFCEQLMQRKGVALVPGGAFGDDRWVRLSYAVSDAELEAALDRIFRFIRTPGSRPCRLKPRWGHASPSSGSPGRCPRSPGAGIPRPTFSPAPSAARAIRGSTAPSS